jgi:PAS domain-containing protein
VKAWNRGAERMYGLRADEVSGRDAREAVSLVMSDEELAQALQEMGPSPRHIDHMRREKGLRGPRLFSCV